MGGSGSGRHGEKNKTTYHPQIDVREWVRAGYFQFGRPFGPIWSGKTGPVTIRFWAHIENRDLVIIVSRYSHDDGRSGEGGEVGINFARTPCNYGYSRVWFVCPACSARAAIIYCDAGEQWVCRKCLNLAYASQSEDACDRAKRRISKIEKVLRRGKADNKPYRMHYNTYDRLLEKKAEAEAVITQKMASQLDGLMQRLERRTRRKGY